MKKIFLLSLTLLAPWLLSAQNLSANLNFARFYNPDLGPYIETYLSVDLNGLKKVPAPDGKYMAQVNLLLLFKQNDSIKEFSKTLLNSPLVNDTNPTNILFYDQQRFFLPKGQYQLEIEFSDANKSEKPTTAFAVVELEYNRNTVQISDIELLSSYTKSTEWKTNTKNGYDMVPHVSNFYPSTDTMLTFYSEIYNTDKAFGANEKFLATAYVSPVGRNQMVNSLILRQKMEARPVNVILSQFNISSLPSGNYQVVVEIRNKSNEFIEARQTMFQVSRPEIPLDNQLLATKPVENTFVSAFSTDSLNIQIESIFPIADATERVTIKNLLREGSENYKRNYLFYFWQQRDATSPQLAWKAYQIELTKADNSFGNKYQRGYQTDRGRIYLQYGPPNTIVDEEFDTGGGQGENNVPYEIWHYYSIGEHRDGKFVFYNPHLVPNGYTLLHSNVVGEINNPHWQTYLKRNQLESIDAPTNDRFDGRSGELYNNPR